MEKEEFSTRYESHYSCSSKKKNSRIICSTCKDEIDGELVGSEWEESVIFKHTKIFQYAIHV